MLELEWRFNCRVPSDVRLEDLKNQVRRLSTEIVDSCWTHDINVYALLYYLYRRLKISQVVVRLER